MVFSLPKQIRQYVKIAIIPCGTINDWGRFWGLTRDFKQSTNVFLQGNVRYIDIGKIESISAQCSNMRFFINAVGLGLDAKVVSITHQLRKVLGNHGFLYTLSLLVAVLSYRPHKAIITSDKEHIDDKIFIMSIGNGCYTGGGLQQTPNAVPDDGLFDVMIAKKSTAWDIFTALSRLFNDTLLEHLVIHSFQAKTLDIMCEENMPLETDGVIINGASPYRVSVIPNAIQMIVPM